MKVVCIICLCCLSAAMVFITVEIISEKISKKIIAMLAMILGLTVVILSMYFIVQLGKKWNIYEETKLSILGVDTLLIIAETIYHIFKKSYN